MRRFSALLLSLLLLIGIAVPFALAETGPAVGVSPVDSPTAPAAADGAEQDAAPTSSARDSAAAQDAGGQTAAVPAASDRETLSQQSVQWASAPANTATAVHFADLRSVLTKYNPTVRSLQASLDEVHDSGNKSALNSALSGLQTLRQGLSAAQADAGAGAQANAGDPASDLFRIYSDLSASLAAGGALVDGQISSLSAQLDSLEQTVETTSNTLSDSIHQLIRGAETLYIGIVTMENAERGIVRTLDTLDRAVSITEKQQELGMASAYDAETMRYQRSQAESGLESLRFQIRTSKLTLESMCAMALNGTVKLDTLDIPSEDALESVEYAKNLTAAANRNVDVRNANAKRDLSDKLSPQRAYEAAIASFACSYKVVCETVPEKQRLTQAAGKTVDYQQRTFDIAAKKYELGMASHEEYLAAQDALESAKDDLVTARLELFTAYRSYVWATQYGIV